MLPPAAKQRRELSTALFFLGTAGNFRQHVPVKKKLPAAAARIKGFMEAKLKQMFTVY